MGGRRTMAFASEPGRDFPEGGNRPSGLSFSFEEIQHAALGLGQSNHIIQMDNILANGCQPPSRFPGRERCSTAGHLLLLFRMRTD